MSENMNVAAPLQQSVSVGVSGDNMTGLFSSDGILKLLVTVRGSSMPDQEKMELRDILLEYSQLHDENERAATRQQVIDKIKPFQGEFSHLLKDQSSEGKKDSSKQGQIDQLPVQPAGEVVTDKANEGKKTVEVEKVVETVPTSSIGRSRLAPSFNSSLASEPNKQVESVKSEVAELSETKVKPEPEPEVVPLKSEAAKVEPVSESSQVVAKDNLARIREIKSKVNAEVGNPINLIDSNNEVGREYMNSLLDAMKKASGGSAAEEVEAAMGRLETAYSAVEKILKNQPPKSQTESADVTVETEKSETTSGYNQVTPPVETQTPKNVELAAAESTPDTQVSAINKPEQQSEGRSVGTPSVENTNIGYQSEVVPLESVADVVEANHMAESGAPDPASVVASDIQSDVESESTQIHEGLYHKPEENILEPEKSAPKMSPLQRLTSRLSAGKSNEKVSEISQPPVDIKMPEPERAPSKMKSAESPVMTPVPEPDKPLSPVTEVETLPEKMEEIKRVIEEKEKAAQRELGEDLDDPMVNAGLEQLLSEWKLFKSSGLLGTGPNGIDHPLYKKLSQLPMAAVVSGRFEGATPEIKQSITDYMNGWRYEQGMVHEMGETFEHYLRRVILYILKKQRQATKTTV